MININDCLSYIKRNMGYPKVSIELSDQDLIDIIQTESRILFQQYVPHSKRRFINKYSKKYRIKKNLYWVRDNNDLEIFWVQDVTPDETSALATGWPYSLPTISVDNIPYMLESINRAKINNQWSRSGLKWYQEHQGNQVWIFSEDGLCTRYSILYTCEHNPDLSSISGEYAIDFMNICLGFSKIAAGSIRSKYGSLQTPVGEIPINNELAAEGKELINATVEKLNTTKPRFVGIKIDTN